MDDDSEGGDGKIEYGIGNLGEEDSLRAIDFFAGRSSDRGLLGFLDGVFISDFGRAEVFFFGVVATFGTDLLRCVA